MLRATSLPALTTEINTDPNAYGYAPLVQSGQDAAIANLLNLPRDGTGGFAAISVKRADVAPNELLEAIDTRDLSAATAPQLAWLQGVANLRAIRLLNDDGTDTRVGANLKLLIPAGGQGSRARIATLSVRVGSRAEQLFGTGTVLSDLDVAAALGR